ncbi:hypothetical protein AB0M95_26085 [Sphaerisporangium sp. NPDC051017]
MDLVLEFVFDALRDDDEAVAGEELQNAQPPIHSEVPQRTSIEN